MLRMVHKRRWQTNSACSLQTFPRTQESGRLPRIVGDESTAALAASSRGQPPYSPPLPMIPRARARGCSRRRSIKSRRSISAASPIPSEPRKAPSTVASPKDAPTVVPHAIRPHARRRSPRPQFGSSSEAEADAADALHRALADVSRRKGQRIRRGTARSRSSARATYRLRPSGCGRR
jgi:hypothetical protein